MKIPESKLPFAGTNIFTKMSGLAFEVGAYNIAQGFPDFPCDPKLISLVDAAMKKGWNQYAPMPGVLKLREKIAEKTFELYQRQYDPMTEVTVMPGATAGIYSAINALVHPGEEVIIIEPCYDSYIPSIIMAGATPVIYKMKFPGYTIDWNELKTLVTGRTRMIMINTPHNPTGGILTHMDMLALQDIVRDTDIIILSDEVYEHIIFDGERHCSISAYRELAERGIMVASFGKTFHTTGWRTGYVLAPEPLMKEIRRLYQFIAFSASTPMQHAIYEYLFDRDTYLHLRSFFQAKRDRMRALIAQSRFSLMPSRGSYFQCVTYEKITDEHDADLAIRLTKEYKVATIPVSAFYRDHTDNKVLRFCFGKTDDTIEKALEIICRI